MSGAPDNKPGFDPNFITSMLPDGTMLQFPKGTPPEVVDKVFREQLAQIPKPQKAPEVGTGEAAAIGGTQGLTFGLGDEIAAGIAATAGLPYGQGAVPGDTWGERYNNALDRGRGVQHAAQEQHPVAFGAGKVAGAVAPALVAPELFGSSYVAAAPTLMSAAGRGAITSGLYGAVTGFNEGEGGLGERAVSAGKGGAIGAAAGAVVSPAVKAIGDAASGFRGSAPTSATAKEAGDAGYKAFDSNTVILTPESLGRLRDTVKTDMAEWGIKPTLEPRAMAALEDIDSAASSGENITMKGLELIRRVAGRSTMSKSDAEASQKIIDHIDDFMENLKPDDILMGDASKALATVKDARANWSAYLKANMIENAIAKAKDSAAVSGTGGNTVNAVRRELMKIVNSPKLARGFSDEELKAIRSVARGGPIENLARIGAAFAPSRGGLNAWMATIASMIPGGQVLPVVGEAAHAFGKNEILNQAEALPQMVLSRAPGVAALPVAPSYSELTARALGGALPAADSGARAWADALLRPPRGAPQ